MKWTVSRVEQRCGAEHGCRIPPDEPIALFVGGRVARCAAHAAAMGYAVDWTEVESERWRLEREIALAATAHMNREPVRPAAPVRIPAPRQPKPAHTLPDLFDPKLAATGERND
jgi:hypothetical protein